MLYGGVDTGNGKSHDGAKETKAFIAGIFQHLRQRRCGMAAWSGTGS